MKTKKKYPETKLLKNYNFQFQNKVLKSEQKLYSENGFPGKTMSIFTFQ